MGGVYLEVGEVIRCRIYWGKSVFEAFSEMGRFGKFDHRGNQHQSLFLLPLHVFKLQNVEAKRCSYQSGMKDIKSGHLPSISLQKLHVLLGKEDGLGTFNGHSQRSSSCYSGQVKSLRGAAPRVAEPLVRFYIARQ
ncbi:hypothetical protein TNCT_609701 [Trichonephila clavata]|uniref:Uncharacterized protein n=1 Tax=Trichonephila clavata TaxID=2740835 RepID=A0A8X6GUN3_TRICU|nr:hypothetical protein TNCT_609701 [Trichonephila clavata]